MTNQKNAKKIIEEFKIKRRNQVLISLPFFLSMLYMIAIEENPRLVIPGFNHKVTALIAILFFIAILFHSFKKWRCPVCNKYLGRRLNIKVCRKCGVKLV